MDNLQEFVESQLSNMIEDLGPYWFMDAVKNALTRDEGRVFQFAGYKKPATANLVKLTATIKDVQSQLYNLEL